MAQNVALSRSDTSIMTGTDIVPITPNDSNDLAFVARAIRCKPNSGTAGTLRVVTLTGDTRDTEIGKGELLTLAVKRVLATGTTAAGLEAVL